MEDKHKIWAISLILIVFIICFTIVWLNSHPYVMRFEMDNNTLEAIKSINYTAINK